MKKEKLFELLTLVNGVTSKQWDMVMGLVKFIKSKDAIVNQSEWHDKWKQSHIDMYPLDLAKIETWSTFDNTCIDLHFSTAVPNETIRCKAKIYDGESFGGHRKELRFEAIISLPAEFITHIHKLISWKFEIFLEDAYENHLESKKQIWINEMKNNILNN